MLCPQCGEILLTYEYQLIETDHCAACGGVWLDRGELEELIRSGGGDAAAVAGALKSARVTARAGRLCPVCRTNMEVIGAGLDARLELDRCRRGHGLWFDRDELRKLIAAADPGREHPVAGYFADLYQRELETE